MKQFPFLEAEEQWNALSLADQQKLLRYLGLEIPPPPSSGPRHMTYGALGESAQDILEGIMMTGRTLNDVLKTGAKQTFGTPSLHAEPSMRNSALKHRHATNRELEQIDAVLTDYLFFATGVDGILWDEGRYKDPNVPCHCLTYQKSTGGESSLCFKKGIIGTLSQDQEAEFCKIMEPIYGSTDLKKRLSSFQRASEACSGMDLSERLNCMSQELKKGGTPAHTLGRTTSLSLS